MKKSLRKLKPKFAVICRLVDCEEDFGIFRLTKSDESGLDDTATFDTVSDARAAMKKDYKSFAESYDVEWSVDGKDHCKRVVLPSEISIDVPIWDGENQKDSWIRARWKVVEL